MRKLVKGIVHVKHATVFQGQNVALLLLAIAIVFLHACKSSNSNQYQQPPQNLPVVTIGSQPATTYLEYTASLEGSNDIEIRPQVEGYLDKIYVDEGARVKKGQRLFHINDNPYRQQLNNAMAGVTAAKANLLSAEINVSKLTPLVENNVISEVQLKTAKATYEAAAASVAQANALVENARINLGYTTITAPVNGYIGRIPAKTGSLASSTNAEPLTILSAVRDVHAWFSLSENDFIQFKNLFPGKTIEEKIKQMPPVELILTDNTVYPQKGKVEIVSGQFNNTTGSISFRATFQNSDGLLRSGNTGRIRIPRTLEALVVPQEATYELQDKVFVFSLADSNKVVSKPITIAGKSTFYYFVDKGIATGEKIVFSGLDRLQDGAVIQPQFISMDSLLKVKPL